ncbi:MAG: VCBS repeat-containing protein, partial [Saprospiraceae bacterium]
MGDIDGDGALDVVVVRDRNYPDGGGIWVWNPRTGAVIASASAGLSGGVPFIGNVTGDCTPEIGMTFRNELRMYRYDGTPQLKLLYSLPTTDKSGFTGITMFDFNQDGRQELVYRDETDLRILDGSTGVTLASYPMKSKTGMEYPVVADVDRDGQADILVNGYQTDSAGVIDLRVYCFESAGAPWAPARSVWNQYGYHVTNINDDLTVPRHPQNQAAHLPGHETCLQPTCPAPYNAFLAQATYRTQQGCVQFPASGDLALNTLRYECSPDSLVFYVAVSNPGSTAVVPPCVYVACYTAMPGSGAVPVTTRCAPLGAVLPGPDTLRIALPMPNPVPVRLYFVVNDPGTGTNAQNHPVTGILECDYTNNTDSITLDLSERTLNLGPDTALCPGAAITLNAGPGFDSYRWSDGSTDLAYSAAGAGPHFVEAADRCGRVYRDTVLVTEFPVATANLGPDRTACPGEPLAFEAAGFDDVQWFSPAVLDCGTCAQVWAVSDSSYELIVVVERDGCYGADTVLVAVPPPVAIEQHATLCAGDTLAFLGAILTQAGRYEFPLNGCDSTLALNLIVQPLPEKIASFALCPGDSVLVGAEWLSDAGTYAVRVSANSGGCDTIFHVSISETPAVFASQTIAICAGDSVLVFGQWVTDNAVLSQTFASAAGCDSVQEIRVLVQSLPEKTASFAF